MLTAFIGQFYDNKEPPKLVLLSDRPAERDLLQEALRVKAGQTVRPEGAAARRQARS